MWNCRQRHNISHIRHGKHWIYKKVDEKEENKNQKQRKSYTFFSLSLSFLHISSGYFPHFVCIYIRRVLKNLFEIFIYHFILRLSICGYLCIFYFYVQFPFVILTICVDSLKMKLIASALDAQWMEKMSSFYFDFGTKLCASFHCICYWIDELLL